MAFSIETIEDDILAALRSGFEPAFQVYDDYIPNNKTLRRSPTGEIEDYVVVQFGDIQPGSTYSMTGPWDDDYGMPVYVQAISSDPKFSRKLARKVVRVLLSKSWPWSGEMRKRPGFNMFAIDSSDASVEAYASPVFFTIPVQMSDEA